MLLNYPKAPVMSGLARQCRIERPSAAASTGAWRRRGAEEKAEGASNGQGRNSIDIQILGANLGQVRRQLQYVLRHYRVRQLVADLGLVVLVLECSTTLLGQ